MTKSKKREAPPKAPKVSLASVAVPPASSHKGGRPKGWKPSEHGKDPGGRPKEWTPERIDALADDLLAWSQDPASMFLASFCRDHDTHRQRLYEFSKESSKFADSLKKAENACEANIAEGTADGAIPPAFGIFGLKQRGWSDKHEIEHSGEIKSHVIQIELPKKA